MLDTIRLLLVKNIARFSLFHGSVKMGSLKKILCDKILTKIIILISQKKKKKKKMISILTKLF